MIKVHDKLRFFDNYKPTMFFINNNLHFIGAFPDWGAIEFHARHIIWDFDKNNYKRIWQFPTHDGLQGYTVTKIKSTNIMLLTGSGDGEGISAIFEIQKHLVGII